MPGLARCLPVPILVALGAGLLVGSVSAAPGRTVYAAFVTPGKAAYCFIPEGQEGPDFVFGCWTPNDGFIVSMRAHDRPAKEYFGPYKGFHDPMVRRLLGFGKGWRAGPWFCALGFDPEVAIAVGPVPGDQSWTLDIDCCGSGGID
jgi:hypothetical protein